MDDGPQFVLLPVHLAADDGEEGFAVDEDANAVLFYYFVERAWFVGVFEMVGEACAAFVADADADEVGCWAGDEGAEALDGCGCLFLLRVSEVSECVCV